MNQVLPISAVFFDVAGTLIDARGSVGRQYAALARDEGVEADEEAIEREFQAALAAAPPLPMAPAGTVSSDVPALERAWWRSVVERVFARLGARERFGDRFDAYFDRLFDHFGRARAWELHADVVPALTRLRQAGCHTGIVTNFDRRVTSLLEELGLRPLLDSITISSLEGIAKPDPAIFHRAAARAGVRARAAAHCGDSLEEDVAGAAAAGLLPILIDRRGRHRDVRGVRRIETMDNIDAFLKGNA